MAHDLTILTLSRNAAYFQRLLDALANQRWATDYQAIVVNNATDPNITALALESGWMTIEPGYNTTYAEGNNLAAKVADGHWLLFLNDDAIPDPEWLMRLWDCRKQADVVGSLLLNEDGTVNHAGTKVSAAGHTDHIGRGEPREDWESFDSPLVPSVTFAAALVLASTFKELGGLDERFIYGYEDSDFCLRVLERGGTIRCARDAVATHGECGTRPRHGGTADQDNLVQFLKLWGHRVGKVLSSYVVASQPEKVEGLWR